LPPGIYDVYWGYGDALQANPWALATNVTVADGNFTRLALDTGVRFYPPTSSDAEASWGLVPVGGTWDARIASALGSVTALPVRNGTYDGWWDAGRGAEPVRVISALAVANGTLATADASEGAPWVEPSVKSPAPEESSGGIPFPAWTAIVAAVIVVLAQRGRR
jgi:hypothetical protein